MSAVAAFAGRRVDAPLASPARFPSSEAGRVRADLAELFAREGIDRVVGSAACGADLILLEVAREQCAQTHIILPFAAKRFRDTSVTDRGDGWGPRFDAALVQARAHGSVTTLDPGAGDDDAAYARVTRFMIEETVRLAAATASPALALAIWDRNPRSTADATQEFTRLARNAGLPMVHISTLPLPPSRG